MISALMSVIHIGEYFVCFVIGIWGCLILIFIDFLVLGFFLWINLYRISPSNGYECFVSYVLDQ
jgi:hypothetical protein